MTIQDGFVKIDKLGRILIPKKIRTDMDITDEALLRINYDSDEKTISFSKAYNNCSECSSPNGIIPFGQKKKICLDCLDKIIEERTEKKDNGKNNI